MGAFKEADTKMASQRIPMYTMIMALQSLNRGKGSTCIKCLDTAVSRANGQKVEGRAECQQQAVLHAHRLHLGIYSRCPALNWMSEREEASLGRPSNASAEQAQFRLFPAGSFNALQTNICTPSLPLCVSRGQEVILQPSRALVSRTVW